jgi:hypothetical protein
MSGYGYLYVPTGECVHFVDECPDVSDLREVRAEAQAKGVKIVYLDCMRYVDRLWDIPNKIGLAAGTSYPPYDEDGEPYWVRWWDDLLSLGWRNDVQGLAIVLDNANVLFESHRKFMTTLLETFLHGMKSWVKQEKPYHLHFQMVSCSAVSEAFGPEETP